MWGWGQDGDDVYPLHQKRIFREFNYPSNSQAAGTKRERISLSFLQYQKEREKGTSCIPRKMISWEKRWSLSLKRGRRISWWQDIEERRNIIKSEQEDWTLFISYHHPSASLKDDVKKTDLQIDYQKWYHKQRPQYVRAPVKKEKGGGSWFFHDEKVKHYIGLALRQLFGKSSRVIRFLIPLQILFILQCSLLPILWYSLSISSPQLAGIIEGLLSIISLSKTLIDHCQKGKRRGTSEMKNEFLERLEPPCMNSTRTFAHQRLRNKVRENEQSVHTTKVSKEVLEPSKIEKRLRISQKVRVNKLSRGSDLNLLMR